MTKYITLTFFAFMLSGCSNMGNTKHITQYIYNTEIVTIKEPTIPTKECPPYVPLSVTITPEVPIVKIRQAADKSDHEVVIVLTKYIRDLREYIAKEKKEELIHQQQYLSNCDSTLK